MSEYSYHCNNTNITYLTKFAKYILNNIDHKLNISSSRCVKWVYEQQTFDGVDQYGPKSIIYNLFIVIYNSDTNIYSCYVYNTE
mgnify:CR=1 FL=1